LVVEVAMVTVAKFSLAPLGVPLLVELNDAGHAAVVEAACRGWAGEPAAGSLPLYLRLAGDPALSGCGPTVVEVRGRQLALRGAGAAGGACADSGEAWCRVSPDFLHSPEQLRSQVLEPLVLFLVTRHGRTPIHAAAIKRGDLAILLAGPSGSGKSTLALAAHHAGWTVMSEDTVYVQAAPELTIWGWPGPVHLLHGEGPMRWRNGKLKHAVALHEAHPDALTASRVAVCLLSRGEAVALQRLAPGEALRLMAPLEPGFDLLAADIRFAQERLVDGGAWMLALSADPDEAIRLLARRLK